MTGHLLACIRDSTSTLLRSALSELPLLGEVSVPRVWDSWVRPAVAQVTAFNHELALASCPIAQVAPVEWRRRRNADRPQRSLPGGCCRAPPPRLVPR